MNSCESNNTYINAILNNAHNTIETTLDALNSSQTPDTTLSNTNDGHLEKPSAVWTTKATETLLKLYEDKLEMLETPKKKTRIWQAISENLKEHEIDVTPDQVRWKINALTKKYKQCIDYGKHDKFKYYKEMDTIYARFNVDNDSYTITELLSNKRKNGHMQASSNHRTISIKRPETKSMIELRKMRLANRIESDRSQGKIQLERQWLEYLQHQEEQKQWKDLISERNLKLREEELEVRKQELELRETLELRKMQLLEKEHNELLHIEREKCELLKQLF